MDNNKITAVYLAAGLSSRFGGIFKAMVKVGPKDESLLELSMKQTKKAGITDFVFVVSNKTINILKDNFKDSFEDLPIKYVFQETPDYRERPFGTAHALLSAKKYVFNKFIVLNSDDLYGEHTLKLVIDYLTKKKDSYCMAGYKLKNTISNIGELIEDYLK